MQNEYSNNKSNSNAINNDKNNSNFKLNYQKYEHKNHNLNVLNEKNIKHKLLIKKQRLFITKKHTIIKKIINNIFSHILNFIIYFDEK